MPKYLSGKSKTASVDHLDENRYKYLDISQAEPNPGYPGPHLGFGDNDTGPVIPGSLELPTGTQYELITIWGDETATRYWKPVGGGLIPGSISVYDESGLVGSISSITQLDFRGLGIGVTALPLGIAATITVAPPGENGSVLFKESDDFATATDFVYNSSVGILTVGTGLHISTDFTSDSPVLNIGIGGSIFRAVSAGTTTLVGIGTTNPKQNLDVVGNIKVSNDVYIGNDLSLEDAGTIIDYSGSGGASSNVLSRAANGIEWVPATQITAGAAGTVSFLQYHKAGGLLGGTGDYDTETGAIGVALVWDNTNERVGIGSTLPRVLFDVLGNSIFTGITTFAGITTVTGDTLFTKQLSVSGLSTFVGAIDANDGITASDVKIENLTAGRVVFAGTDKKIEDSSDLTFNGSGLLTKDLDVSGISTLGNVKIYNNIVTTESGTLYLNSGDSTGVQIDEAVFIGDSTESTSFDTGSLHTNGGVGVELKLNVGGAAVIEGIPSISHAYKFNDNTVGSEQAPEDGQIYFDQSSISSNNILYISAKDDNGVDNSSIFNSLANDDIVKIFNKSGTAEDGQYISYEITGTPSVVGSGLTYTFPLSYIKDNWTPTILDGTALRVDVTKKEEVSVNLSSSGGITTTGGDLYVGGNVFLSDDIFLDEGNFQKGNFQKLDVTDLATFNGEINAFDKVGIGTTNPTRELTIYSPDSGSTYINLTNAITGNTTSNGFGIGLGGDEDAKLWNYENTNMIFGTNSKERLRIDLSGRLLVGDFSSSTDTSQTTITAKGNSTSATGFSVIDLRRGEAADAENDVLGYIRFSDTNIDSGNQNYAHIHAAVDGASTSASDNPGRLVFSTTADGVGIASERLRITSTGTVGIATITPRAKFDVRPGGHSGDGAIIFTHNIGEVGSDNNCIEAINGIGDALQPLGYRATEHIFATQDTEKLRIKSGGTISIPAQGANNANPRLLFESAVDDNDFSFSQYEDVNGTYTLIGQNLQLDQLGNVEVLDSSHKTAGITIDARNHGGVWFYTGLDNEYEERLRILSTGEVGIGTKFPDKLLTVGINTTNEYSYDASNTPNLNTLLTLTNKSGTDGIGTGYYSAMRFSIADGAISEGWLSFIRTADNKGDFTFKARNAASGTNQYPELMRIKSTGDVGIGITNPTATDIKTALESNTKVLAVGVVTTNTLYGTVIGGITVPTGDITIPEFIKHKDNTDTKFGFPDDDVFAVNIDGTERLRITNDKVMFSVDAEVDTHNERDLGTLNTRWKNLYLGTDLFVTGKSGIGTTNPQSKLDVRGNAIFGLEYISGAGDGLNAPGITTIRGHHVNSEGDFARLYFANSKSATGSTGFTTEATASIRGVRDTGNYKTALSFYTNDSAVSASNPHGEGLERLRIDSDGRLLMNGITAVDNYMLQMEGAGGTGKVPAILFKNGTAATDEIIGGWTAYNSVNQVASILAHEESANDDAYIAFKTRKTGGSTADFTEKLRITSDGNVGIGTINPQANFAAGSTTTKLAVLTNPTESGFHETAHFAGGSDADDTGAIVRIGHYGNDRGLYIKAGRESGDRAIAYVGLRTSDATDNNVLTIKQNGADYSVGIGTDDPVGVNSITGNNATLVVGNIVADVYHGTLKGTIDNDVSTFTLNTNLTDIFSRSNNQLSAQDATADKLVFWDDDANESAGELTYATVSDGLGFSDTTLRGSTYSFTGGGSDGSSFGTGSATLTLTGAGSSEGDNDLYTITAGTNVQITSTGDAGFTISSKNTEGSNTTYGLDTTGESTADGDGETAAKLGYIKWELTDDGANSEGSVTLTAGTNITFTDIDNSTGNGEDASITINSAGSENTTYDLKVSSNAIGEGESATTRHGITLLSSAGVGDTVGLIGSNGIDITGSTETGTITIDGLNAQGTTYTLNSDGTDGSTFGGETGGIGNIKLVDGNANNAGIVSIIAGDNIKIDSTGSDGFTINADQGSFASNAFETFKIEGNGVTEENPPASVVAESATDTMTFVGAGGMTITTDASNDKITFNSANNNTLYDFDCHNYTASDEENAPSAGVYLRLSTNETTPVRDLVKVVGQENKITVSRNNASEIEIGISDSTEVGIPKPLSSSNRRFNVMTWTGTDNADNDPGPTYVGNGLHFFRSDQSNPHAKIEISSQNEFLFHQDVLPASINNLGSSLKRWDNLYINDLQLSNESKKDTGGNDVDGTWGDWTLQEGEENIYMINNRTGKKYAMMLREVE